MRTLLGEPTGTSPKFAAMMESAVLEFMEKQGVTLDKVTNMPLEGDGTIERRVEKFVLSPLVLEQTIIKFIQAIRVLFNQEGMVSTPNQITAKAQSSQPFRIEDLHELVCRSINHTKLTPFFR